MNIKLGEFWKKSNFIPKFMKTDAYTTDINTAILQFLFLLSKSFVPV
jgi:hypothetical protein